MIRCIIIQAGGTALRVVMEGNEVESVKKHEESDKIRYTWSWPQEAETAEVDGNLYTLQEYKQKGGYVIHKKIIHIKMSTKPGFFNSENINHKVIFYSESDIPEGIICYTKNDAGAVYILGEPLSPKSSKALIIRVGKDDYLKFHASDAKNYSIRW
jgi:hypothetical protein